MKIKEERLSKTKKGETIQDQDTEIEAADEEQERGATIRDQERGEGAPIDPAENETSHSYNLRARTDKTVTNKFNEIYS